MELKPFLQGFALVAIILTLAPFIAADYWWIRIFDFPHTQLTILTLVALLVYFFRFNLKAAEDYILVGVLGACLTFQVVRILPYLPHGNVEMKETNSGTTAPSVKFYIANVLQTNENYDKIKAEIAKEDADVLLFMETDSKWMNKLRPAVKDYKYRAEEPLDNTYGMLLYSRLPLKDPKIKYLVDDSIPSIHTIIQLRDGKEFKLYAIHPTPPMPQHNPSSTDRDAEMMLVAKEVRNREIPVIVAGDFNDVAWSESTSMFKKISELLDPRVGRGFYNTFNAKNPLMRWPLDHFFASDEFRLKSITLGEEIGSDHFPAVFEISLEPEGAGQQEQEDASGEDLEDANKQIREARKDNSQEAKKKT
ncbi:endonuclease/exonuclease/phosphatase family protein [Antarcticibacterium sp. 1MA-6-2]|uniref:endonuclease/exonuclease/phosphatase family protein n=1 Tax=Antarcticibacterium sp. 1MA-6-2 TaxID=2908210 RepID=UPI001F31CD66|nr:endonuclease/exonuclease/phosphatase family protein [Antarcticibacterium sp. 1MA-6-2]UJH91776.1 endonuclease/exonuclease/phosphatase family protein [Antarcticibacterium sp. 1MA-6-2]